MRVVKLVSLGVLAALSACRLVAGIEDIQLTTDAGPPGKLPSVVFSRGNETIDEIISDGQYIYARTLTGILRCPVAGCGSTPELLVTIGSLATITDMLLAGGDIYYAVAGTSVDNDGGLPVPANDGTIHVVGKDGKGDRVYKGGLADAVALGSDATSLYWLDDPSALASTGTATASRCALTTCVTVQSLITKVDTSLLASSDTTFFVRGADLFVLAADGTTQAFYTCPTATPCGAAPKKFATGLQSDDEFFPDPQRLFYGTAKGDVGFLGANGMKTALAGGQPAATSVIADANFVYFTTPSTGTVLRLANTGTPATPGPFAMQQPSASHLAQDPTSVYWVVDTGTGGNSVLRLAK